MASLLNIGESVYCDSIGPEVEATSESKFAQKIGVSPSTVHGQLRDGRSPNFDFVAAIFPSVAEATQDRLLAALTVRTDIRFYRLQIDSVEEAPVIVSKMFGAFHRLFESIVFHRYSSEINGVIADQRTLLEQLAIAVSRTNGRTTNARTRRSL